MTKPVPLAQGIEVRVMKRIPTVEELATRSQPFASLAHLVHRWRELFLNYSQRAPQFAPLYELLRNDLVEQSIFGLARNYMQGRSLDFRDPAAKRIADSYVVYAFTRACTEAGLLPLFKELQAFIVRAHRPDRAARPAGL